MGLTPVEMIMYGLLAASALILFLLTLWHLLRIGQRKVQHWYERRKRRPEEIANLKTENARLRAEHTMMARRLEVVMEQAQAEVAAMAARASRAVNRAGWLKEELEAARQRISAHEDTIALLGQQLAQLREELAKTKKRAEELYAQRSELDLELQMRMDELRASNEKLLRKERALDEAQEELKRVRNQARELTAALQEKRNRVLHQKERIERLEKELSERQEALRKMEEKLASERTRFVREKIRLQDAISELSARLAQQEAAVVTPVAGERKNEERHAAAG